MGREQRKIGQILIETQKAYLFGRLKKGARHTNPSKVKRDVLDIYRDLPKITTRFVEDLFWLQLDANKKLGIDENKKEKIDQFVRLKLVEQVNKMKPFDLEKIGVEDVDAFHERIVKESKVNLYDLVGEGRAECILHLIEELKQNRYRNVRETLVTILDNTVKILAAQSSEDVRQKEKRILFLPKGEYELRILKILFDKGLICYPAESSKEFMLTSVGFRVAEELKYEK